MFQKLKAADLKLKPNKCKFFKTKITHLGHVMSKGGVQTDTRKTCSVPNTVTDEHSFLGFTNYFHHFMKGYAKVANLLYALISGENVTCKNKAIQWTDECQKALHTIKTSAQVP